MKLQIKGKQLLEQSEAGNIHQLSLRARISAQTAYKYLDKPEEIKAADLGVLLSILVDGMGLTPAQVLDLKMGDVFEIK